MGISSKGNNKDTIEFFESLISEWRTVFDSILDMVSVIDTDHRFIRVNRPFAKFLGVEPQDLIGKKCHEVMHGTARPVSYCPIAKSTSIKHPIQKEVYDSIRDKHFMISLSPILDEKGNVQSIVHIMRDITESKKAEEDLIISAMYIDTISDALLVGTTDTRLIRVNAATFELWGYSSEELIGMSVLELFPEEEAPKHKAEMKKAIKTGVLSCFETIALTKKGKRIPIELRGKVLTDDQGNVLELIAIVNDITERKMAEKALEESEIRFKTLFNQAADCILLMSYDPEDEPVIVDINESGCKMHGFTRDEIVGKSISFLDDDTTKEGIKQRIQNIKKEGIYKFEGGHVRKDGSTFPVDIVVQLIQIAGKSYLLGIDRDISDRKK